MVHEQLKREVIEGLDKNRALRERLSVGWVEWQTPVVGIQNIFLDEGPGRLIRTADGARGLSEKEYALVLQNWKRNLIGGTATLDSAGRKKTWFPPKDSRLYRLQKIGYSQEMKVFEYFLLICEGKHYFLSGNFGPRNSLRVLGDDEDAYYFRHALENVLSWKPSNA